MKDEEMHFAHVDCAEQPPFHYRACGLDNVYLRSGYTQRDVGGETYTSVQNADELHEALAAHLVLRRKVLRGQEVRFLRKFLGLTQAELGDILSVSDQSVARYEKEQVALEGPADRFLRVIVMGKLTGAVDPVAIVEEIRQSDSLTSDDLVLERTDDHWKVAA